MKTLFRLICVGSLIAGCLLWSTSCTSPTDPPKDGGTQEETTPEKKKEECSYSSNCACSQTCKENVCEEISCGDDDDCRCKWRCVDGQCYDPETAPCRDNKDCKKSETLWKCDNGKCIDGGCRKDSDCTEDPAKTVCNTETNQCEKKPCVSDGDCKDSSKPICKGGDCVADTGASIGEECSENKPCLKSLECYDDNGKKTCLKPCDPFGSKKQCDTGQVCFQTPGPTLQGLCIAAGDGSKEGEECGADKKCQRHLYCAYTGKKETCHKRCLDDKNCGSEERCLAYKKEKLCLPKPDPCGLGRSCDGEADGSERCVSGLCKLLLCPDQRTCPKTDKCQEENGRCLPRECPKDACDPLYECKNNRCVRTNEGRRCGQGQEVGINDCGNGLTCTNVGYVAVCARTCTDGKCPQGMNCQTNLDKKQICVENCPAPKSCRYPNFFCMELKRGLKGNICVPPGQPSGKDAMETCDNQNQCLPDLKCYRGFSGKSGYCLANCTTNADCAGIPNAVCESTFDGTGCFYKCNGSGRCTINGTINGYCTRGRKTRTYVCRPS